MGESLEPIDRPLGGEVGEGTRESPRLVVEVWLGVCAPEGPRVLMCRRIPEHGDFWQGVSGRVEASDETLRNAAMRELAEELGAGIRIESLHDLGRRYDFKGLIKGRRYRKHSLAVLLPSDTKPEHVTLSEEHTEARLMTFDEARSVARFPEYVTELDALEALLAGP